MTRRHCRSAPFGAVLFVMFALLSVPPAVAEGSADGQWVAARLAAPGVYWVESIEFKGTVSCYKFQRYPLMNVNDAKIRCAVSKEIKTHVKLNIRQINYE